MIEVDKIYCTDVLDGLRSLPDDSIDLIVTSPPYNKGYWSPNKNQVVNTICAGIRRINYVAHDDTMEPEEYEAWQRKILDECIRVLKDTGSIFYNNKEVLSRMNAHNPTFVYDYPVLETIIWDRGGTTAIDKRYFFPVTEYIYWIKKGRNSRPYFNRSCAEFQKNIWKISPETKNTHPAPFPIDIPRNCILACTKEGDVVLDPFMGSGTTALAAKTHNRHYIGFELNEEYIKQAEDRLK